MLEADMMAKGFSYLSGLPQYKIVKQLKMCIIYAMAFAINESHDASDYERFSKYLLRKRLSSSQKEDTLAVITMNWDDVFNASVKPNKSKFLFPCGRWLDRNRKRKVWVHTSIPS